MPEAGQLIADGQQLLLEGGSLLGRPLAGVQVIHQNREPSASAVRLQACGDDLPELAENSVAAHLDALDLVVVVIAEHHQGETHQFATDGHRRAGEFWSLRPLPNFAIA